MIHTCPACGTVNDAWRPFCTRCSLRLDGSKHGPPGTAGSALARYSPVGARGDAGADPGAVVAPARRPRRGRVAVALIALAVAASGIGGVALTRRIGRTNVAVRAPAHWDPRLAPLVRITEHLRGLRFKHPVAAAFYTDAQFNRLGTAGLDSTSSRTELAHTAAELRALGLAPAKVDLGGAVRSLVDSSVLAFYDSRTKRISVRGTKLDVAHDVTLVHELTHALQDQYFDLESLRRHDDDNHSDSVTALIEGDARDVEDRYVDALPAATRTAYLGEQDRDAKAARAQDQSVPDVLALSEQAPYDLGEQFVRALRSVGGTDRVNRAFRDPPRSDWYYDDPLAYLNGAKVIRVARPALPHGARFVSDEGETGSFGLFLMLAERIDAHTALAASDAWRGDDTLLFTLGRDTCLTIDLAAASPAGSRTIESALRSWSAQMPAGRTAVERRDPRLVRLRACDAGAHTPPATHHAMQAYPLVVTRSVLLATFLAEHIDGDTAWCTADQVVYGSTVADIDDPQGRAFSAPGFAARLRGWLQGCEADPSN